MSSASTIELPMFPLGSVLLPGEPLSLQVFEPRYRRMLGDCLMSDPPGFGVVLIERGSEVGGGDERAGVGVFGAIRTIGTLGPGRLGVLLTGADRLRIVEWLPDDPYPRAAVEVWPDDAANEPSSDVPERATLVDRVETSRDLAARLDPRLVTEPVELSSNPVTFSYQLVSRAPLGPADRYRLLAADGPEARLVLLGELLDDVDAAMRFRLGDA